MSPLPQHLKIALLFTAPTGTFPSQAVQMWWGKWGLRGRDRDTYTDTGVIQDAQTVLRHFITYWKWKGNNWLFSSLKRLHNRIKFLNIKNCYNPLQDGHFPFSTTPFSPCLPKVFMVPIRIYTSICILFLVWYSSHFLIMLHRLHNFNLLWYHHLISLASLEHNAGFLGFLAI